MVWHTEQRRSQVTHFQSVGALLTRHADRQLSKAFSKDTDHCLMRCRLRPGGGYIAVCNPFTDKNLRYGSLFAGCLMATRRTA